MTMTERCVDEDGPYRCRLDAGHWGVHQEMDHIWINYLPGPRSRRGVIVLPEQTLHHLLDLPEGYEVLTIWADPDTRGIKILVSSAELNEVADGSVAPMLNFGKFQIERYTVHDEETDKVDVYMRLNWGRDG